MKKAFLSRLLAVFSAGILGIYGTIYACGGGDWDWDWMYATNFTPETFVDKTYEPLFLSQALFYGDEPMRDYTKFNEAIVSDWSGFLQHVMKAEDVQFFLLDSSATDVTAVYDFIKSKKKSELSKKWAAKLKIKDKNVKGFFEFLYYAKQIETASVTVDFWSYEPVEYKYFNNATVLSDIENIYKNTSNEFLKKRWWFQTIKAYFYSGDKTKAVAFFKQTEGNVFKDVLYYRALAYIAGIQYKSKNYAESNYNYSIVFDRCPEMRDVAVFCFHPQEQKDWQQSLAMAKNADEKAALWALYGYYGDEEQAIANIFEVKPQSEYLEFLLTRLVNRQEVKADLSFSDKTVAQNKAAIKDSISESARTLVVKIAQSEKVGKPYLWNTAAGYLETLAGNFSTAAAHFADAEKIMPQTELAINQLRLLRFVNTLSSFNTIDAQKEQKITADLNWLYQELPKKENGVFRFQLASDWSKRYLGALYLENKNAVMSELFARKDNFYDNSQHLEAMKVFLPRANKTPMEQIAVAVYNVSIEDIYRYESVKATFQNKIADAIVLLQKSGSQDTPFLGNPFNAGIKDCHDCDHQIQQKRKYSFMDFLLKVKEMQSKISKSEDIYTNSILLGNAFYNITHYGNGRIFHEGNIFGYAVTPFDFREHSRILATNCTVAKSYYQKALAAAKNDEQRAHCQYMIAKCERNAYYNDKAKKAENYWQVDDDGINFLAWNGFKSLKNNYSKTQYYQEVLQECGYFKTYISQQKQ